MALGELTLAVSRGRRVYRAPTSDLDPTLVDDALTPALLAALLGRVDSARGLAGRLGAPLGPVAHTLASRYARGQLQRH